MSTTGWRVGTSVVSQPSVSSARDGVVRPLGGAALALEHVRAHASRRSRRGGRAGAAPSGARRPRCHALAQLQHRLLRGRPVAAGAGDEDLVLPGTARRCGRAPPRPRPAATRRPRRAGRRSPRRRRCSSPCGTTTARSPACTRSPRSASSASGDSGLPVTSQIGPRNARAASSVSACRPRARRRRACRPSGGSSTASSACTAQPARLRGVERRAAAGEDDARAVRQPPVRRHLPQPLGLREHRATRLAGHSPVYTIRRVEAIPVHAPRARALPRLRSRWGTSTTPSTRRTSSRRGSASSAGLDAVHPRARGDRLPRGAARGRGGRGARRAALGSARRASTSST